MPGLADLLRLNAEPDGSLTSRPGRGRHVFGGLLMARALGAAAATVDSGRVAHSVRGTFLLAGDGRVPVRWLVEQTLSGGSFSSRRVVAQQDDRDLFAAAVGFHVPERGPAYEQPGPRGVPAPDDLPAGRYDSAAFDSRDVPVGALAGVAGSPPHARQSWFRARHALPDDPVVHAQALVYLTDSGATRAVRQPHADHPRVEDRMSLSLDHSVWLHAPVHVDAWLLYELWPVTTGGGRGLALGAVRTADGRLVASVAQEALFRLPDS